MDAMSTRLASMLRDVCHDGQMIHAIYTWNAQHNLGYPDCPVREVTPFIPKKQETEADDDEEDE